MAEGLILSAPVFAPPVRDRSFLARAPGLSERRASGGGAWRHRDAFAAGLTHDPWRGGVTVAWQGANPDLRMGGPSVRWTDAYRGLANAARRDLRLLPMPTLVLEGRGAQGCRTAPVCEARSWPAAGRSLELEGEPIRAAWLGAVASFVNARALKQHPPGESAFQGRSAPIAFAPTIRPAPKGGDSSQ